MSPTRYFPSVWSPIGVQLGGLYNLLTHHLSEQFYWHVNRSFINTWRKNTLGIPPLPLYGPFREERWQNQLLFYGFSPLLVPRPGDWPDNAHVTGFWFPPEDSNWQPEERLVSFMDEGPPPVFIGFGSMPEDNPSELRQIILEALRLTGQRAVVQGKWLGEDVPDSVFPMEWVSHPWTFSRCCAVIHHGGAGTIAQSLKAGIPNIVIPHAWDQFFWGERVYKLGVASKPINRRQLTAKKLSCAIDMALNSETVKARATEIGSCIRDEAGSEKAVKIIDDYLHTFG
jgi:sterol 3beta-glucosyltransferase